MEFIFFKQAPPNTRQQKIIEIQIKKNLIFFGFPVPPLNWRYT